MKPPSFTASQTFDRTLSFLLGFFLNFIGFGIVLLASLIWIGGGAAEQQAGLRQAAKWMIIWSGIGLILVFVVLAAILLAGAGTNSPLIYPVKLSS